LYPPRSLERSPIKSPGLSGNWPWDGATGKESSQPERNCSAWADAEGVAFVLVCLVEEKSLARIERQIAQRLAAATRSSFLPVPFRLLLLFLQETLGISHVIRVHAPLLREQPCRIHPFQAPEPACRTLQRLLLKLAHEILLPNGRSIPPWPRLPKGAGARASSSAAATTSSETMNSPCLPM